MWTPEDRAVAAGHSIDTARWWVLSARPGHDRIAGRFRRVEPRATARAYLLGLLSRTERKHLGTDDGVLIVDETGFLKKGRSSAGVQRQYTGTAGRIENSQVGVFLAYASSRGRALIDRRLYLPEQTWCQDTERRTRAGIPGHLAFATKPALAGQMNAAALEAGISASWVTGGRLVAALSCCAARPSCGSRLAPICAYGKDCAPSGRSPPLGAVPVPVSTGSRGARSGARAGRGSPALRPAMLRRLRRPASECPSGTRGRRRGAARTRMRIQHNEPCR